MEKKLIYPAAEYMPAVFNQCIFVVLLQCVEYFSTVPAAAGTEFASSLQDHENSRIEPMRTLLRRYARDARGFSLVELMVVTALVAVLAAIAVPNLLRSLPEKRLRTAARNLYAAMQKARLQAVKENRKMLIMRDDKGIFIFADLNGNNSYDANTKEPFLDANSNNKWDSGEQFTDIDGDGTYDPTGVSEPFTDVNRDGKLTIDDYQLRLADYSGVTYGSGSAGDGSGNGKCNWNGAACDQASYISFSPNGTAGSGSIYLQNQNDDVSYAAAVSIFGNVKLRRFNDPTWDK